MGTNLEKFRTDLKRLREEAEAMQKELDVLGLERASPEPDLKKKLAQLKAKFAGAFDTPYQRWYTEACAVLAQLIRVRLFSAT